VLTVRAYGSDPVPISKLQGQSRLEGLFVILLCSIGAARNSLTVARPRKETLWLRDYRTIRWIRGPSKIPGRVYPVLAKRARAYVHPAYGGRRVAQLYRGRIYAGISAMLVATAAFLRQLAQLAHFARGTQ